jgi:hypothetical protein
MSDEKHESGADQVLSEPSKMANDFFDNISGGGGHHHHEDDDKDDGADDKDEDD